jgi:hypothetical protein
MHAVVIVHPFVYNEFLTFCNPPESEWWCTRRAAKATNDMKLYIKLIDRV